VVITSRQNPRVTGLLSLRRRSERERAGLLLVEGHDELAVALASGARPIELYHCPALAEAPDADELLRRAEAAGAHVVEVSASVFERVAYRQAPDGWLAVLPAIPTGLDRLVVPDGGAVRDHETVDASPLRSRATSARCCAPPTPPASTR
jgi:TrmH family RNA methyltransferase